MDQASGQIQALLGLSEFRVLVEEFPEEQWISAETTADVRLSTRTCWRRHDPVRRRFFAVSTM
jgi:hypothetical protein